MLGQNIAQHALANQSRDDVTEANPEQDKQDHSCGYMYTGLFYRGKRLLLCQI